MSKEQGVYKAYWDEVRMRTEVSMAHYRGLIYTGLGVLYLYAWMNGVTQTVVPAGLMAGIVCLVVAVNIIVYVSAFFKMSGFWTSVLTLGVDALATILLTTLTGGPRSIYNLLLLFFLIRLMYFPHMARLMASTAIITLVVVLNVVWWMGLSETITILDVGTQMIIILGVFLIANLQADRLKDSVIGYQKASMEMKKQTEKIEDYQSRIERFAELDPLTQIYNRQYFNTIIDDHFAGSNPKTGTGHLSLVLVSTRNLKEINESHGPHKGDEVLRKLAESINSNIREEDWLFRYSGNALAVLVSAKDEEDVEEVAKRCRYLAHDLNVEDAEGNPIYIDVVTGHASTHTGAKSAFDLIRAAEDMLRNYRNAERRVPDVETASPEPEKGSVEAERSTADPNSN